MITIVLIAANILVFIAMLISGVSIFEPTTQSIVDWGGMSSDLVIGGQWWRLLSSMFVHIGLLHLAMNMYVLYSIGSFLERFLGRTLFITSYLVTGVLSGLCSFIANQNSLIVSAGASGAIAGIFGIYGFILLTPLIPKQIRSKLLKNVGYVLVINVFYGLQKGGNLDHAAHLGGLFFGLGIGAMVYPFLSFHLWVHKVKFVMQKIWLQRISATCIIVLALILVPTVIAGKKPSDYLQFSKSLQEFCVIEEEINSLLSEINRSNPLLIEEESSKVAFKIEQAKKHLAKMTLYQLDPESTKIQDFLSQYYDLYEQRFHLFVLAIKQNTQQYDFELERITAQMEALSDSNTPSKNTN